MDNTLNYLREISTEDKTYVLVKPLKRQDININQLKTQIQPNNQIYIPNVMIHLSQKETNAPRLAAEIPYSKITLNRALSELVSRKLLYTTGNATRKIYKPIDRAEMGKKGKEFLFNPVEKVFYATYKLCHDGFFISGETALARLGASLNVPNTLYYAATSERIKSIDKKKF